MPRPSNAELIQKLVENNISLQNKTADLIKEVGKLTKSMDTMVELFENAAKNIQSGTDEPLLRKLDGLLEQNKNIARGLILLERYVRERNSADDLFPPKPLPRSEF